MGRWPALGEGWGGDGWGGGHALRGETLVAVGWLASRPVVRECVPCHASPPRFYPVPSVRLFYLIGDSPLMRPATPLSRFSAYAMTLPSKGIWHHCRAIAGGSRGWNPEP